MLEQLLEEYAGKIKITKVNVDDHGELATKYGVNNLPTTLFFVNGEVRDQQVGFVAKEIFSAKIEPLIESSSEGTA